MLVMPGALSLRLLYLWHFNVWLSQLSINNKGDILFTVDLAALRASSSSSDRLPMSVTARRCRSMWCNTASVRLRIKLAYTSSQLRLYKLYKKSIWFVKTIATYAQRFYSKICEIKNYGCNGASENSLPLDSDFMFKITHIQIRQLQWGYYCSNIAVICSNREFFFVKLLRQ